MLAFPPFRLDLDQEQVWKGETLLVLRRKPFAILRHLAQHPKQLVTHDELLKEVWRGAVVSDSAMRSHLHELRQVLGEGVIETVIGRGYRFIAQLSDEVDAASAPQRTEDDPLVVGRDAELAVLRSAFDRALGGKRQVCFVTGEPGIGKSTLVRTFLAGLDQSAVIIGRGGCFEQHGTPEPYLAIIDALGELARSPRRAQVQAALVRHAPTFVAQVPQLVDQEQLAEAIRRAAGGNESRQLRELSEAIEALCSQAPLVLLLEDLQWSDVATIDLLSFLGQRHERAKLLVIGTCRHAEAQSPDQPLNRVLRSLVARAGAVSIPVPKIDVAAVQRFIDRRFAGHAFPQALTELVCRITSGTPLFLVSLLDELVGRGMLVEQDRKWTLTVSIDDVQAHRPASVKQLIDMQLDRLPAVEQRVLEAASIVGAEFSTSLVAAALELPVEQVDDICDALARRSLFLRAEPGDRYGVTHALVQEVCAERGSPSRRQRWHRLVAEALERAGEVSQLLAKHFEAAGDPARAIPAYRKAARQAESRYASADAASLCARALDLLPRLPATRERDVLELQILDTMCQQLNSSSFSAGFAGRDTLATYARAIELARSLGEPSSLYGAIMQLCSYYMIIAEYERCAPLAAELEQIERAHDLDPQLLHSGVFARGYIAFFGGDLAAALRTFERLVPAEHETSVFHGNLPGRTLALGHLACVRWVIGEPDRALDEALATLELAAQIKVPILQALAHVVRTRQRFLRRDPRELIEQEARDAERAASLDLGLHTEARAFAVWVDARRSPLPLAAIEPLLEGLRQRLHEVSTCSTLVALMLIDALRLSGHAAHARELTDEIIAFAVAHKELVYLPELLRVRGEQRKDIDPSAAQEDYKQAVELARSIGAHSFEQRAMASLDSRVGIYRAARPSGTLRREVSRVATSLLALLDDIATVLDDVAVLTKVAAKKTAGVLGDDLALNAQQVAGVDANRELPVVWAVAKGSAVNKLILVPVALAISQLAPWLVTPLLMFGGVFLCFEGVEKLAHKFLHPEEEASDRAQLHQALLDPSVDLVALEKEKIKGAIRTDFVLSAEIIAITLGAAAEAAFMTRLAVLAGISALMTVGVYGFVAGIVKIDDAGIYLNGRSGEGAVTQLQRGVGKLLLLGAPILMKLLSIAGTAAMFLVGGGILTHGIPAVHHAIEHVAQQTRELPGGEVLSVIVPPVGDGLIGVIAGALALGAVTVFQRVRG